MSRYGKVIKHHQIIPDEVKDAFKSCGLADKQKYEYAAALRAVGWSCVAISAALDVTRSNVEHRSGKVQLSAATQLVIDLNLPLPRPPVYERPPARKFVEPTEETLNRLLELKPFAEQVRSNSPRYRKEAEEYVWLLNYAHTVEGVTLYRLAKRLGCTHGAIRFRLARYGYKPSETGTARCYTPVLVENRVELRSGTN